MSEFTEHSQIVTTNNYNTLKITVTIAYIKSSNHMVSLNRLVSNSFSAILLKLLNSQFQLSN
jgi:hypothetical protein